MVVLNEVLEQMEQVGRRGFAMPFDLEVVSYDRKTKKAGKIKEYKNAVLCTSKGRHTSKRDKSITRLRKRINQNHFVNSTRNIELPSGEVKKIHIWLIRRFNNKKVVWNVHG